MQNVDCFQILEYIRSSIEIIMNLKIDDLERNDKKPGTNAPSDVQSEISGTETCLSKISIESQNLI